MLCQFGQTRNGSEATHLIVLSSTAKSSATGDYVAVPERFGQNDEPASRNKEQARNKLSSVQKHKKTTHSEVMYICNMYSYISINNLFNFFEFVNLFLLWSTFWSCILYFYLLCRRKKKRFDVHFWRIRPVQFPSKDRKDAAFEERKWWEGVFFPPELAFLLCENYD